MGEPPPYTDGMNILTLALAAFFGFIGVAWLAHARGRNPYLWALGSAVVTPVVAIVLLLVLRRPLLSPRRSIAEGDPRPALNAVTVKCPDCRLPIRAWVLTCPHCGSTDLPGAINWPNDPRPESNGVFRETEAQRH